jgi:hypothetical protein
MKKADIGLIGLAVMGENLVMNMESKGFTVSVFNRTTDKVKNFQKLHLPIRRNTGKPCGTVFLFRRVLLHVGAAPWKKGSDHICPGNCVPSTFRPVRVEELASLGIQPLVHVGAEVVSLSLQQVGRQEFACVSVEIGKA